MYPRYRLPCRVGELNRKSTGGSVVRPTTRIPLATKFATRPYNAMRSMIVRGMAGLAMIGVVVAIVLVGREGYVDSSGNAITFLSALYYATVSITTTGYGDIVPVTPEARLVTTIIVTPLRMGFLILLLGTTVEVLATHTGVQLKREFWRRKVNAHYIICGWGVKGRSAAEALLSQGIDRSQIVVVEQARSLVDDAAEAGFVTIQGNATRTRTLEEAQIQKAKCVIVAVDSDEAAVLTTLTARDLNESARIVAAVRETENAHLLEQGGATTTIVSAEESGRLLGIASERPALANILHDLLHADSGLYLDEVPISDTAQLGAIEGLAIAVVRDGETVPLDSESSLTAQARSGDQLIILARRQLVEPSD